MRVRTFVFAVLALLPACVHAVDVQAQSSAAVVPPLVRYAGFVKGKPSGVVGVTFALYVV